MSDPRNNGVATVRIEDPKGGREGYTFDLEWTGGSYGNDGRLGNNGRLGDGGFGANDRIRRNDRLGRDDGFGNNRGARSRASAEDLQSCRDAIMQRISRDGYNRVNILSAEADDNSGRNDYIVGRATARGRSGVVEFDFSCAMNFNNGRVRSVELNRR